MIKKLLLGLTLTTGLMMANTTSTDDLLSLATMGKTAGSALEMNKSDMEKADGGWYGSPRFVIRGYHQNRMNKIASYIKPKYNTIPSPQYQAPETKRTYHLGIGKSVYMTPTAFKSYLARNY
jgi:hypothetical protein